MYILDSTPGIECILSGFRRYLQFINTDLAHPILHLIFSSLLGCYNIYMTYSLHTAGTEMAQSLIVVAYHQICKVELPLVATTEWLHGILLTEL